MTCYGIPPVILILQILIAYGKLINCPTDAEGWKKRSEEIHCPLGEEYHCGILTSDIVNEFCFEPAAVEPNFCPRFDIFLSKTITAVDCKGDGCPTAHYITSNLFLYPKCFIMDTSNAEFSETNSTLTLENSSTNYPRISKQLHFQDGRSDSNMTNETTIKITELSQRFWTSISTEETGRNTNANDKSGSKWTQQIIIPSGLSLLLLLVISSIAVICICKRRKRRIQKNIKSMTNDQISKNPNVLMEESNGYNTIEEVELNIYREDNEDTPRLDESEINITNEISEEREYCPIQRKEQKSQYSTIQQNSEQDVNSNESSSPREINGYEEPAVNKYEKLLPFTRSDIDLNEYSHLENKRDLNRDMYCVQEFEDGQVQGPASTEIM